MNSWEFYSRIEMFKHTQKDDELAHYGITGQKWGQRRWQNADGTFNEAGKERYFGTKRSSSSDDKMGGARSNVKDYLKFRNKMLKKHAKADMDKWYIEEHKEDDKKLLKDAKRIDKSAKKMYENQLKDYYDNPNDLVDDLNKVYKFGGKNENQKFGSSESHWKQLDESNRDSYGKSEEQYWKDKEKAEKYLDENYDKDFAQVIKDDYDTTGEWGDVDAAYEQFKENPYEYLKKYSRDPKYNLSPKEEKKAAKEAKRLNNEFDDCVGYHEKEELMDSLIHDSEYIPLFEEIRKNNREKYGKEKDRAAEIFDGFDNQGNEIYAKAGITNALLYNGDDTLGHISDMARHYAYDDGDQGNSNSSSLYAKYEKDADYDELSNLFETLCNNEEMIRDNINTLKKDRTLSKVKEEYLEDLVEHNNWSRINSRLYNATEDSSDKNDDERNAYTESKKIAKKLESSCGARGSGWYYLNQAINNLGMANMSYKELTDADWNRINDEVNKLKR